MPSVQKNSKQNSQFEFSIAAAVCLLFLVALVSLLGTFPSDPLPSEAKAARLTNALITLTRFSGGRALYSGPFFIFLLGVLGLFVGYALLGQIRSHFKPVVPVVFIPLSNVLLASSGGESLKDLLGKTLISFGYSQPSFDKAGVKGKKNLSGKFGPLGIHLGFLIVLLAGLVTFLGSDVRETEVRETEALVLPKEKIELRLDKFIIFRHAGSERPSQYMSRFWVKDKNRGGHVDLSVNHPLKLGGTKIFQMRYRVEIPRAEVLVYEKGNPAERVLLEAGKPYTLSPDGPVIFYDKVIPDFKLTKDGVVSGGGSYERSAIRLHLREPDGREKSVWIFPAAFGVHGSPEKERQFGILKLHKVYYSGVRISYDPGLPLACVGFFILIFSAFFSSFAIPRRLRIGWSQEGPLNTKLVVEGWCPRDPLGLQDEADRLVLSLALQEKTASTKGRP